MGVLCEIAKENIPKETIMFPDGPFVPGYIFLKHIFLRVQLKFFQQKSANIHHTWMDFYLDGSHLRLLQNPEKRHGVLPFW